MRTGIVALGLVTVLNCGLAAEPASQPAVDLGRRYFNLKEGYSLCPPAATGRVQERAASRSVTWSAIDPATGAVAWMLSATRHSKNSNGIRAQSQPQAEELAEMMRKEISKDRETRLESCQVIAAAGRKAIDSQMVRAGKGLTWCRQVIVLMTPNESLQLTIFGPAADHDRLLTIHQAVLDSLELLDPQELLRQRQAHLAAGKQFLAGLTVEKFLAALNTQDEWFLLKQGGKPIGCLVSRERPATVAGRPGVEVKAWSLVAAGDGTMQKTAAVMIASADRSTESCHWVINGGDGKNPKALSMTKEGYKLVFAFAGPSTDMSARVSEKILDASTDSSYLPVAMNEMFGRLVDLKAAGSYAFASYAGNAPELDVYTFTVAGEQEIELGGKKVQAVRAAARQTEDAEEQTLLLDQAGRVLQETTPDGAVFERSTRQEVLEQFPQAKALWPQIDADQASQPVPGEAK
jgi:hypothetical protein